MIRDARRGIRVYSTLLLTGAALAVLTAGCSSSSTSTPPVDASLPKDTVPSAGGTVGGGTGGTVAIDASPDYTATGGTGGTVAIDASPDHTATGGADSNGTGGTVATDASPDLSGSRTDGGETGGTVAIDASPDYPPISGQDAAVDAAVGPNADANNNNDGGAGTCPSPEWASYYNVPMLENVAWDKDGNIITGATVFSNATVFGSKPLTNVAGAGDVLVAKIDPSSGNAFWVFTAGDSSEQYVTSIAASSAGVGVIGTFLGTLDMFNGTQPDKVLGNPGTSVIDFIAGLADDGSIGLWAIKVNLGDGQLNAIAGQPGKDYFVVCGVATNNAASLAVTGTTTPPGTPGGGNDVVVAAVKASDGTILWSHLFGGAGDQACTAAALDDDGNAIFAGTYAGTLDLGLGALSPAPTGASDQIMWVAKLNGTTGATMVANAFGTKGLVLPNGIAADSHGNVIAAGQFGTGVAFGSTTLPAPAGVGDAFAAKLDSNLVPSWARRWGGPATASAGCNAVAVDSMGNVTAAGTFVSTINEGLGSFVLTAPVPVVQVPFVVVLDGSVGQPLCAQVYSDAASHGAYAEGVAVNRWATGAGQNATAVVGSFTKVIDFPPPATPLSTVAPGGSGYMLRM
jgi:hypothetical protein